MNRHPTRIRGLDTLRSIAILVVICWHFQEKTPIGWIKTIGHYGWAGVDLFFVLSGYLISNQLFRSLTETSRIFFSDFYIRRALRILPCFLVVLVLYVSYPDFREGVWNEPVWRFLTFTQNFGLRFGAFSHAWSLCIEEQFYWAFPVLALLLSRSRRASVMVFVGVLLSGMLIRGFLWNGVLHAGITGRELLRAYYRLIYYPTYSRIDGLTLGVGVALIQNFLPNMWSKMRIRGNALALVGCLFVVISLSLFENRFALSTVVFGFPLLALGCACLVASAASGQSSLSTIRIPGTSWLATLAYCIYLTHKQVIHLVQNVVERYDLKGHPIVEMLVSAIAIGVAGSILHTLVEKPFLKLRNYQTKKFPPRWLSRPPIPS